MKKLLTILVAVAATLAVTTSLTSCKDDKKNKQWDPNAMISLRPDTKQAANATTKANPEHLSAIEIVKQAETIMYWNHKTNPNNYITRGFAETQKDTIAPRLLMFGTDVISSQGEYVAAFIEGEDIVITRMVSDVAGDTVAYVPNSVLRATQPLIKAAFDIQDYATCYTLFDQAFIFIPITGAEWRALKAQGLN